MSEQQQSPQSGQEPARQPEKAPAAESAPAPKRMDPVRKWVLIFGAFCLFLLAWYMAADRYTPFTTQARVNAFVVPIAPQVAGEILTVDVRTNEIVKKGQLLAQIDPARYELAVAAAEAQLALTEQNLKVSSSTVDAAAASLDAAPAEYAAPLYAYLASTLSESVTGQIFVAAGGFVGRFSRPPLAALGYRDHHESPPWSLREIDAMLAATALGANP